MSGRTKITESVISICLLLSLVLIAAAIFTAQSRYDPEKFTVPTFWKNDITNSTTSDDSPALADHIPLTFQPDGQPQIYQPDTLFEKINGKADLYLDCEFQQLYYQRFADKSEPQSWFEVYVYDMATNTNAFAAFSQQRRPKTIRLPFTAFAYKTIDAVFFTREKYYVEIRPSELSESLLEAMLTTAENFSKDSKINDDLQKMLALFPRQNLLENSFKFYRRDVFGFDGLSDTFTAQYSFDDLRATAFLSLRATQADAGKTSRAYYEFLIANGAEKKSALTPAFQGRIVDFYDSTELIFTRGRFLAGVHAAPNQQSAENLAAMLDAALAESLEK